MNNKASLVAFLIMLFELFSYIVQVVTVGEASIVTKISLSIFISTLLIVISIEKGK